MLVLIHCILDRCPSHIFLTWITCLLSIPVHIGTLHRHLYRTLYLVMFPWKIKKAAPQSHQFLPITLLPSSPVVEDLQII
uniref:Uncharacterized protein n=1 Tax=Picea sitchensis TaxID=3332 RepID=A9NQS4_PICSI|nr:unknown [Picea sitchensis]